MTAVADETRELTEVVLETLRRSASPLSPSQIEQQLGKRFRRPRAELETLLASLVETGSVSRFSRLRGSWRFWTQPIEEYIDAELRRVMADRPKTRSDVLKAVKKRLEGVSEDRIGERIRELAKAGVLQEWPTVLGGRSRLFSARQVEPDFYVGDALSKLIEKLSKAGLSSQAVLEAARTEIERQVTRQTGIPADEPASIPSDEPKPSDDSAGPQTEAADFSTPLEELILERMPVVEPRAREGGLVPLADLRRCLDFQHTAKGDFDEAVLNLAREWKVSLSRHPHVAGLTEDERNDLVADGEGNFYNGIAFRRS